MSRLITVASCSLNQWAIDWDGNLARIKTSIREAKAQGARLRVGSELEICGYGCLDHFLEDDVYLNSWQMLMEILEDDDCNEILLDIGMPIKHGKQRLNCRVLALNGKVILIRPKLWLANEGNYHEMRYFDAWSTPSYLEDYHLPPDVAAVLGCNTVPIGDAILSTRDTTIYSEDLLTPPSQHDVLVQNGVNVFTVSAAFQQSIGTTSALIHEFQQRSKVNGRIVVWSNQKGCDGDRFYYGGKATVMVNGTIAAQVPQFNLNDVEMAVATVSMSQAPRCRGTSEHRSDRTHEGPMYSRVNVDFSLSKPEQDIDETRLSSTRQQLHQHTEEQELVLGPACWLWDMLRRSRAAGFLCPLSGGIDSCSTATLVYGMCRLVMAALEDGNYQVTMDVQKIVRYPGTENSRLPNTAEELCNYILHTLYMGVTAHSSVETRTRAQKLASSIGAYHVDTDIDALFLAQRNLLSRCTNYDPKFSIYGGSKVENLALHNIQARSRMVTAYYFAQMLPTVRQRHGSGNLLVLGSVNLEECMRGNVTKHDCSSADLSVTGGTSKLDIRRIVQWAQTAFSLPILGEFLDAPPTGELEPRRSGRVKSDEKDMGMSYGEIFTMAKLRKEERMGPVAMFKKLLIDWHDEKSPRDIATLVKKFHHFHAINRHKMTTMTPAYHAANYSAEDPRPFLYPEFQDNWACRRIDEILADVEGKGGERKDSVM